MDLRKIACTALLGICVSNAALPNVADARKQTEYRYPFSRVWNSALRMMRVDMRLPVTDRDQDAGYMLFEYIDGERRYPGSIELVASEQDKRPVVKAVISVEGMPSYVEQMLLDKLEKKLEAEYGQPMEPPKVEEPPAKEPPAKAPPAKDPPEKPVKPTDDEAAPSDEPFDS